LRKWTAISLRDDEALVTFHVLANIHLEVLTGVATQASYRSFRVYGKVREKLEIVSA
jgi:hypothetical protein